jgi:hypothetical protein
MRREPLQSANGSTPRGNPEIQRSPERKFSMKRTCENKGSSRGPSEKNAVHCQQGLSVISLSLKK